MEFKNLELAAKDYLRFNREKDKIIYDKIVEGVITEVNEDYLISNGKQINWLTNEVGHKFVHTKYGNMYKSSFKRAWAYFKMKDKYLF